MNAKRTRIGAAALVLAFGLSTMPGAVQAATVKRTATGGTLANGHSSAGEPPVIAGAPLEQQFKLSGGKFKRKQVLDVNLTVNSIGTPATSDATQDQANFQLLGRLVGPKGQNVAIGFSQGGQSLVDLKLDDQSELQLCDPFRIQRSECNYLQGASQSSSLTGAGIGGFFSGSSSSVRFNPTFQGTNPKGIWRLLWWDTAGGPLITIGETTLEVRTGKRFEKDD